MWITASYPPTIPNTPETASSIHIRRSPLLRAGPFCWQTLARNWHCRYGELDIVSRDDTGIIVFVEVKTRRTLRYGTPQEAVTPSKQINLRHAAVQWLSDSDHRTPHNGVRFDVVTVIVRDGKPLVHHIEGAF